MKSKQVKEKHPKIEYGRCGTCGHFGDDCTGLDFNELVGLAQSLANKFAHEFKTDAEISGAEAVDFLQAVHERARLILGGR